MTLLLATDFDGTIAEIHARPGDAWIAEEVREFFERCLARGDVSIAIISGRDLDDLQRRTGALTVWHAGSHGLEIAAPDGGVSRLAQPFADEPPSRWADDAVAAGFRIERKKFGFALHWRAVGGLTARHPLAEELRGWAHTHGLSTIDGRSVLEVRVSGPSKLDALKTIAERSGATSVSYAGDDVTDHEALVWAGARGSGFLVRSGERPDDLLEGVIAVSSRSELLARWMKLVSRGKPR